jgi:hypothetical protein
MSCSGEASRGPLGEAAGCIRAFEASPPDAYGEPPGDGAVDATRGAAVALA